MFRRPNHMIADCEPCGPTVFGKLWTQRAALKMDALPDDYYDLLEARPFDSFPNCMKIPGP